MIISFRFKNFRSFLDETFIDMKAVNYKEHPNHLVMAGNKKLLKTLAIYGANSSGKTNIFLAFTSFHSFIFWQLFFQWRTFPENILCRSYRSALWIEFFHFWMRKSTPSQRKWSLPLSAESGSMNMASLS